MKRKIIFSGLGLLAVAAVVVVIWLSQEKEPASETGTSQSAINKRESAMRKMALTSPERFQTRTVAKREAPKPLSVPRTRPKQLSEVDKSSIENQQPALSREPVAVSDLYFYKDYESMRKEGIRNPDSKENRAGVVALLQARQRRASAESTKY